MTLLGQFTGNPRDALGAFSAAAPASPDTFRLSNVPSRFGLYDSAGDTGQVALTTQVMTAVPIWIPAGKTVTNISFRTGATAADTPTNWWVALYSKASTPALLAQSADQTTGAIAANGTKTVALATPQKITEDGFYWAALMVKATAVPTLLGTGVFPAITGLGERNLSVSSGSSLTTTAPATLATPTAKNFAPALVLT